MNKKINMIIAVTLLIATIGTAIAESTVIYYNQPNNGYWNIDQYLWIEQKAPTTFWASYFSFANTDYGGYIGVQTTSTGDKALFSIWNANAASGQDCSTFSGEGIGYHCYLPMQASLYTSYRLRVWRLDSDSNGQWWGAWIYNGTSDNFIGQIRTNISNTQLKDSVDFTEYYGQYSTCNQIPKSIVAWTSPTFNNGQYSSTYDSYAYDACTNFNVNPNYYGWIRVEKGS